MRRLPLAVSVLVLLASCTRAAVEPAAVPTTRAVPATTTTATAPEAGPVAAPVRHPAAHRTIYFVMTDRFQDGDAANDTGGLPADAGPLSHGHLATATGYYLGGDLAGMRAKLGYLERLGVDAIWITPPFANRTVQGDGTETGSSAGYHGYWQIDWTRIDPHLGTHQEMLAFIEEAHERDLAVYLDIVVNHTGDVIVYEEGTYAYRSTSAVPYLDSSGRPFDPAEVAGSDRFPRLDPEISFPYTPVFSEGDAGAKAPDWLDDPTMYHNRGNSTFQGESSIYGDFFGLDDLFTERPEVVGGMIELYSDVIRRYPVDGFRVDTVKHVNDELWAEFVPAILAVAEEEGRDDFFVFGEVFSEDPIFVSRYTTVLGFPSVLDFLVDAAIHRYVSGGLDASVLAGAFDDDDWYTDADSNASMLVTFFGNHDIGRMGNRIATANPGAGDDELLARMRLGFDLLFLTRGVPVVYYGDEQGFTGDGGGRLARQPMFHTEVPEYVDDDSIGTDATPATDNFDSGHPLYSWVADLATLRRDHPTLVDGAQIVHATERTVFGFSRIDRDERVEYLVLANNAEVGTEVAMTTLTARATWTAVHGPKQTVSSDGEGRLTVAVPALGSVVLVADRPVPIPEPPPSVRLVRPDPGIEIPTPRYRLEAEVTDGRYAEVTFAMSVDGDEPEILGTDDAPPYRLYWNNASLPAGARVSLIATVDDGSGRLASDQVEVTLGERG